MKSENMPLIEAVIPSYNTPNDVLDRCIDSVLAQTYSNYKVYLIDDGSADEYKRVCDQQGDKDSRIVVVHQDNAGVSAARNTGIKRTSGDYLTFIDADDELLPEAWEIVVKHMTEQVCDCCVMGWINYEEDASYEHLPWHEEAIIAARDMQTQICGDNFACGGGYPWNKVWKRQALLDAYGSIPLFDESLDRYEDKLWVLHALDSLDNVLMIQDILYLYHYQPNSLTQNKSELYIRLNKSYHALDMILDYIENRNLDAYRAGYNFYFRTCVGDLDALVKNNESKEQISKSRKALHLICKRIPPRKLDYPVFSEAFFTWLFYWIMPVVKR